MRLYKPSGPLNALGMKVSKDLHTRISAIFVKYQATDVRDLEVLISHTAMYVGAFASLDKRSKQLKKRRAQSRDGGQ